MNIVYMINTEYPNKKAHSVQMTKTLYVLKRYFSVTCIVNKLTVEQDRIYQAIADRYGLNLSSVKFVEIPKKKLVGLSFFYFLIRFNKVLPKDSIFYTRSYNLAKRLSRTKFLHQKKVILESHKKDGYFKEELVPGLSKYTKIRQEKEKDNINISTLKNIYSRVDLLLFTSKKSAEIVKKDIGVKKIDYIWYPLFSKINFTFNRNKNIVYIGSISSYKLIDLLVDTLVLVKDCHIDIYGGSVKEKKEFIQKCRRKGVTNYNLYDYMPYKDLSTVLKDYKYGLALMEGIKVVDYLENGIIPIIPRVATYLDIFPEESVVYFNPDDPEDLADKLRNLENVKVDLGKLKKIRDFYSLDNYGERLSNRIFSLCKD